MTVLFDVRNLAVRYGKVEALHGLSLTVRAGEIVTIIGPNGAGKSTALNALAGLLPCTGEIQWLGQPVMHMSVEDRLVQGLTLVPEKRELFSGMSVQDNLTLGGFAQRRDRAWARVGLAQVYERFPRLRERRDQLAGTLSGGERQMLAIARALMSRPKLLMLDEPSLGLAPLIVLEVFNIIRGLREQGVAVLLVEQNARAALRASEHAHVLESGEVTLSGPSATVANDERVIQSYLGIGAHPSSATDTSKVQVPNEVAARA